MSWDNAGGRDGRWNGEPATPSGSGWNEGETSAGLPPASRGEFGGGEQNIGGGNGEVNRNNGDCFNCGEEGHSKADCTNPPKSRACFNCGEEGHTKADCPNPAVEREFTGTCRLCELQGHRAADCPTRPPTICSNCKQEGHDAAKCENPRKLTRDHVKDIPGQDAWELLKTAVNERDLDDVKEHFEEYVKATPDITYVELEKAFRTQNLGIYLIAYEKELATTYTNMDLQGVLDRKHTVTWRWSPVACRPREKEFWPETPEENLERLADAGEPVDRGIPKCGNCDQLGHIRSKCPEEKQEHADRAMVKCFNCEDIGHRVRDCPNPRPDKFACRNCKQSGHSSKECPEPRSAEGVECKKCGEVGHFSRDCPQGGGGGGACHNCGEEGHRKQECTNPPKIVCRNCDEEGHTGKECPKPRDWSRVKCSVCEEMGHGKMRCPKSKAEGGDGGVSRGTGGNFGGGEDTAKARSDERNWGTSANDSGAVAATGGDNWDQQASGSAW